MEAPTIEIRGVTASGKSALAYLVKTALAEHGIGCEISGDEDERPGVIATTYKNRLASIKGTVKVKTVRCIKV